MTIEELEKSGQIIFKGIVGSQAYGISTPTSDVDIKGVFIQPLDDILGFGYKEQISDSTNDTTYFEIRRFLQLLQSANPTMLELLNLPEDCIIYSHPIMDQIKNQKEKFLVSGCKNSFGGYAVEQIRKARGLNKRIVKVPITVRKDVIDFCYAIEDCQTIPLKEYLSNKNLDPYKCGLVKIPHTRDLYSLYYSDVHDYRGIYAEDGNDVRTTSIPKGEKSLFSITFNKDDYSIHCKEYKASKEWEEKRNPARYADNMLHGKGYDGKNLAHCHRLLDMAIEIGSGKGINVLRPNREELLSIRRGEMDYDQLVASAEEKIRLMDNLFESSNLPKKVDKKFINDLLIKIRKEFYKLN